MNEKFTLNVEHDPTGLWFVTSPEIRGLLIAKPTMDEALQSVPKTLSGLTIASDQPRETKS